MFASCLGAVAQRSGLGSGYGTAPSLPGLPSASPTGSGAPNFSVAPIDVRPSPAMLRRRAQSNFARMEKDSTRIAELSDKLSQATAAPPRAAAQPEIDRELAEVERLSREVRRLMTDQ